MKKCNHKCFWLERRWLGSDGTPMVHFYCAECGLDDKGHVYADVEKWKGTTVSVEGITENVTNEQ